MLVYERGGGGSTLGVPTASQKLAPDLVTMARKVGRQEDPVVRQLIARAHINDYAQRQLARARLAARMGPAGNMDCGVAAYGKLAAGTLEPIRARIAMQIGGADALVWPVGDLGGMTPSLNYLNGRVMSIAGGSNEMQRNGIGERVLGLPRDPSFDTNKPFSEVVRQARHWSGQVG